MKKTTDYTEKFKSFRNRTLYERLASQQQNFIKELSFKYRLTFQEFRQIVEACRDLTMWQETDLKSWWKGQVNGIGSTTIHDKKGILQKLHLHLDQLRRQEKVYTKSNNFKPLSREPNIVVIEESEKKIYGKCPVASDKTVCCNLHTIDAVENCLYGCSYCTIQTFYGKDIIVQNDIKKKLETIPIDPDRFYHFGTGQSSDSLAWGNLHRILDDHCQFAANHPNILMEFKTKSNNIKYLLENDIPKNVVCSWSLNTPVIIDNEEHFTASLDQRIIAARIVADRGIKVAFHFHPLVWYDGWNKDYSRIADQLMDTFNTEEVLFISFGSVTLIKPVIQKIRDLGNPTKTLQMQFIKDPHGKLTYPDDIKITMFRQLYDKFKSWQNLVFFYLCMEKAGIWEATLGYVYDNNKEFENEFGKMTMSKI